MQFPNDAVSTSTYASNVVSFGDITTQLLPQGDYTILHWFLSGNAKTFVDITCSTDNPDWRIGRMITNNAVINYIQNDVQEECDNGTINLIQRSGTSATDSNYVQITYVPRLLSQTSMATDTPFITAKFFDNGTEYTYNPLITLIGILILTSAVIAVVYWFIKRYKKL